MRFVLVGVAAIWGAVLGIDVAAAREVVRSDAPAGTIVIRNAARTLEFGLGNGTAVRYQVAVGRMGKQWFGRTAVERKVVNPTWSPPAVVRRDNPNLPDLVPPGPRNPLGTRAIVLAKEEIAIHGTNAPDSIGRAVSYGCIRMHNADVEDLFQRVSVGTPVVVVR